MPHKHKRRRTDEGASFDLPPTSTAKPLPAFTPRAPERVESESQGSKENKRSRRRSQKDRTSGKTIDDDDTPRAFAQLLNFHKTGKGLPSALDDGRRKENKSKKRKRGEGDASKEKKDDAGSVAQTSTTTTPTTTTKTTTTTPPLKIQAGERLRDFVARVDQSMPLSRLRSKSEPGQQNLQKLGIKDADRKTKHNRRLERMQKQWREEEARRKDKLEEEWEGREDEREEQDMLWNGIGGAGRGKKGAKKGKPRRKTGPVDNDDDDDDDDHVDHDEDPWAEFDKKKRAESRQVNLQDVVKAPPKLKGLVRSRFKVHGGAVAVDVDSVPASVGSLRKREQAAELRRGVIDAYRLLRSTA